jgi:hypothetical protein
LTVSLLSILTLQTIYFEEIIVNASKRLLLPIDESRTRYLMLWPVLDDFADFSATTLDARSLRLLGLVDDFCSQ